MTITFAQVEVKSKNSQGCLSQLNNKALTFRW